MVIVEVEPSGNAVTDKDGLCVIVEVKTGLAIVRDGVMAGELAVDPPRSTLSDPYKMEMTEAPMPKEDDSCVALEVTTTTGGVIVPEAVGIFRVNAVGSARDDEVGVGAGPSVFAVTITGSWAVTAVKYWTVIFWVGRAVVGAGVTFVAHTHFPTLVPSNCLETEGILSR